MTRACPEEEVCGTLTVLYGQNPTHAGRQIEGYFPDLQSDQAEELALAREQLPEWIAQEQEDVEKDRDLWERVEALQGGPGPRVPEKAWLGQELALTRQIAAQTRLLLQMRKQSQEQLAVGSQQSAEEAAEGFGENAAERNEANYINESNHLTKKSNRNEADEESNVEGSQEQSAVSGPQSHHGPPDRSRKMRLRETKPITSMNPST